jgi:glycosyltransferase involved in cell wall biosynthesis
MSSLSICIPARHEEFLPQTIDSILTNMRGDTEIIVVLDGEWPLEPIQDHPKVHLIYHPEPIGQRAAVNEAARVSTADFIMKLDAHCVVDEGFDVKLMEPYETGELERDVTTMPRLYNLHAFDWVCPKCGRHFYQGPVRTECGIRDDKGNKQKDRDNNDSGCWYTGDDFIKEVVFKPRFNRGSDHMRFDATLHFQYWRDFKKDPRSQNTDFPELFGNLGACVFMYRDRFWELGGMDEAHGSWGQFGTEISCKSWLSGGRQVTNRRTWYSHLFRTQEGFSFPYKQNWKQINKGREYSRDLWNNNKWPQQIRPLKWLIRHFWPIRCVGPDEWTDPGPAPKAGIVYYTDNELNPMIAAVCRRQLQAAAGDRELVSVTRKSMAYGRNVVVPGERGRLQMFRQILAGLEASTADYVFLCEHDVLYHPSHFEIEPPREDTIYYNVNTCHVDVAGKHGVKYTTHQVASLCAYRPLLLDYYRKLVAAVEADGYDHSWGYEPGSWLGRKTFMPIPTCDWSSKFPNIDIRHDQNLTASRWSQDQFHDKRTCQNWQEITTIEGWSVAVIDFPCWLADYCHLHPRTVRLGSR